MKSILLKNSKHPENFQMVLFLLQPWAS